MEGTGQTSKGHPLPGDITMLLNQWADGDSKALGVVLEELYEELRSRARQFVQRDAPDLLQGTALVNEIYLRLLRANKIRFQDRQHFFHVTARMMRRILVEQARRRLAIKRGCNNNTTFHEELVIPTGKQMDPATALAVDKALANLEKNHPEVAKVIELRIFAGMRDREIAELLGISFSTVRRRWDMGKRLLFIELN